MNGERRVLTRDVIRGVAVRWIREHIADGWHLEDAIANGGGHLGNGEWVQRRGHTIEVLEAEGIRLEPRWKFSLESVWREALKADRPPVPTQEKLFAD